MSAVALELFLSDEVQRLLDDFAALLDVRVTFFSLSGEFLRRGKAMRNCEYCRLVQDGLGRRERCVSMDCDKQREAVEMGRIIDYRCHAGLHECLAPVMVRGVAAGMQKDGLTVGGFSRHGEHDLPVSLFQKSLCNGPLFPGIALCGKSSRLDLL